MCLDADSVDLLEFCVMVADVGFRHYEADVFDELFSSFFQVG